MTKDLPPVAIAQTLQQHRQRIDSIDSDLVALLAKRFIETRAIGQIKANNALPSVDPAREHEKLETLATLAEKAHVPVHTIKAIMRTIMHDVALEHNRLKQMGHEQK